MTAGRQKSLKLPKGAKRATAEPASKSWTLKHPIRPPGTSSDAIEAIMAVKGLAHNAVTTAQFSQSPFGELALTECVEALHEAVTGIHAGDLRDAESLLTAQAVALNAIFTNLALRAHTNMGQHLNAAELYMRLALKAQGQCRATLETLATIKNPPTVFARQANIAHGPQQVNNGTAQAPSRAGNQETEQNKLLEAHGERLDIGATSTTGESRQALATVGTLHRSAHK